MNDKVKIVEDVGYEIQIKEKKDKKKKDNKDKAGDSDENNSV